MIGFLFLVIHLKKIQLALQNKGIYIFKTEKYYRRVLTLK